MDAAPNLERSNFRLLISIINRDARISLGHNLKLAFSSDAAYFPSSSLIQISESLELGAKLQVERACVPSLTPEVHHEATKPLESF